MHATIISVLKTFWNGLCDLVYPPLCILCKKYLFTADRTIVLCPGCEAQIKQNLPPFCPKCSRHSIEEYASGRLCRQCRSTQPHFDSAVGVCLYNPAMRKLIHLFKYGNKLALRHPFSKIIRSFTDSYTKDMRQYDVVTAVPLHPARLRERGYNQSDILAQTIAETFQLPFCEGNLLRSKHTQFQARLTQKDRWTNIQGAFKIKNPERFHEKSVLVVDDLLTTGATLSEIARVIKETGAHKVDVLTVAIADSDNDVP